jgi:hypothetical protein
MRLILVGSADVGLDHGAFVDSCDLVIRFNLCQNWNVNTGTRTDVLCVSNTGPPAREMYRRRQLAALPGIGAVREVWFCRPRRSRLESLLLGWRGHPELVEYGARIVAANGLSRKRVQYVDKRFYRAVWGKLLSTGETRACMPSSGMLAVERVLSQGRFGGYEKYLVGFTHQGWNGHPWGLEKRMIEGYVCAGLMKRLDPL